MAGGSPNCCWAFTSAQHGVVLRKRDEHATDLAHLQAEFLRSVAVSPTPRPLVPSTSPGALSFSFSLPAALLQAGVEPEAVVALLQGNRGGSGSSAGEQVRPGRGLTLAHISRIYSHHSLTTQRTTTR